VIVDNNTTSVASERGKCQRQSRRTAGASIGLSSNASSSGTISTAAAAQIVQDQQQEDSREQSIARRVLRNGSNLLGFRHVLWSLLVPARHAEP
jgi:hypothetical protein